LNTPQIKSPQFAVTKRKSAMVHSRDAKAKYFEVPTGLKRPGITHGVENTYS